MRKKGEKKKYITHCGRVSKPVFRSHESGRGRSAQTVEGKSSSSTEFFDSKFLNGDSSLSDRVGFIVANPANLNLIAEQLRNLLKTSNAIYKAGKLPPFGGRAQDCNSMFEVRNRF